MCTERGGGGGGGGGDGLRWDGMDLPATYCAAQRAARVGREVGWTVYLDYYLHQTSFLNCILHQTSDVKDVLVMYHGSVRDVWGMQAGYLSEQAFQVGDKQIYVCRWKTSTLL